MAEMKDEEHHDTVRPRIVALETWRERADADIAGLRANHQTLASQLIEHGKTLLDHARMLTQHAENIARSREEARAAKQAASDAEHSTSATATAIAAHIGSIQTETAAQTAALRTLVAWHRAPWFRAAVVLGAAVGGFVAALVLKGVIRW